LPAGGRAGRRTRKLGCLQALDLVAESRCLEVEVGGGLAHAVRRDGSFHQKRGPKARGIPAADDRGVSCARNEVVIVDDKITEARWCVRDQSPIRAEICHSLGLWGGGHCVRSRASDRARSVRARSGAPDGSISPLKSVEPYLLYRE
jgi:hypothetical protein